MIKELYCIPVNTARKLFPWATRFVMTGKNSLIAFETENDFKKWMEIWKEKKLSEKLKVNN